MNTDRTRLFQDLKLTQKIYLFFIVLVFLIGTSAALNVTTTLDFQDSYNAVEEYSIPSVIIASELKDHVHVGLLAVYNYVSTGNPESKAEFSERFTQALRSEIELFSLSQTTQDFVFTQNFNNQLSNIGEAADVLILTYEQNPDDPAIADQLMVLNQLRDDFNLFIEQEITNQAQTQVSSTDQKISDSLRLIWFYIGLILLSIVVIIGLVIRFVTNGITKPVHQLTQAAQRFASGDFAPVDIPGNDELGLFANTFNSMASDIQINQEALHEELEKTKALDQQKSEFLSVAAHQLRTPMAGIRWVSQMLYDGDMGDMNTEQKHHLSKGLENVDRMIKLINDLLDVTKIEEQKANYVFEATDLGSLITQIVDETSEQAEAKNVTVHAEIADKMAHAEVDLAKMKLALTNLVDNAIKYSPDGEVHITLLDQDSEIVCTVQDTGIGIPKHVQDQLFTKFFRAPNAMKVFADGSGLGLFMVHDIIEKHDGTISFESAENEGTTFTVTIPLVHVVTEQEQAIESAKKNVT